MESKYPEFKQLNLPEINKEILRYWNENEIFEKSISSREHGENYTFYEGPPSANGMPGIHHVMSRTLKDLFCRYKTLEGFQVRRKAGWDTHGLPVELGVEKELGITKEDIGKSISVKDYNEACKKAVMRYTDVWNDLTEKMGYWVDMEHPYVTYRSKYMESVWWLLKQLWDKELIYKGYTIQPYSPKAGTGLSSHELNMPGAYREVKDTSMIAQFPLLVDEKAKALFGDLTEDLPVYMLAWTTTPWTLPSNTALTVGKKIPYVMVESFNRYTHQRQRVLLAETLVGKYFNEEFKDADMAAYAKDGKKIPWKLVWKGTGNDLLELRYDQLLKYAQPYQNPENAFRVIAGDFVTTEDGTGIVHTAPTFGADDAKVAKDAKPEVPPMLVLDEEGNPVPLVDLQGKFRPEMGALSGKYVKNEYYADQDVPERSADVEIAIKLKEENKAFLVEKYVHSYPHCWRTDKPVLYYPLDSWFIKVTEKRDTLVELNKKINWKPKSTGEGRFGNWLENANDWNLSRSRYWGIPLPIWSTEDGKERRIFGSVAELKEACDRAVESGMMKNHPLEGFIPGDMSEANYEQVDLHRHIVDEITLVSEDGAPMYREADLIDVWFDSGSMPYAQWHYPFENEDVFKERYPADFIAEGVDQTRGWFYTLHAIGGMVFDSVAYKNVVSNGLVLDKKGNKMSKRLGNAVDPFETIAKYGSDAVRWYLMSNAQPWDNLKFDLEGVAEVQRRFFGTLYNTYSFFSLYANIDKYVWNEQELTPVDERPEIDRWILSRLQVVEKAVRGQFSDYEPTRATRLVMEFVDEELSNWYVRLCRRRFWKGEMSRDKQMAYETLYECLMSLSKLISPVAPFFSDWLYQNLTAPLSNEFKEDSVHLTYFGEQKSDRVDEELNKRMKLAQQISSMVLGLRKKESIKVRQPLQKMMIPALSEEISERIESIREIVLAEVNVKELEIMKDVSGVLVKRIKPDFKKLGPKVGKQMKQVAAAINELDQEGIDTFEKTGHLKLALDGQAYHIDLEDVIISTEDIPGWLMATENHLTVALDISISDELRYEGIARELVNRIQNLRKDNGLEVTDHIALKMERNKEVNEALKRNESYITQETLTRNLELTDHLEGGLEVEFDGISTRIYLEKV